MALIKQDWLRWNINRRSVPYYKSKNGLNKFYAIFWEARTTFPSQFRNVIDSTAMSITSAAREVLRFFGYP